MYDIFTSSGKLVDPFTMGAADVNVRDIAHALSNIARWNGHTLFHISVAQHSVLTSQLAKDVFDADVITQQAALFHDAAEYLLCDLPSPLKAHPTFAGYCTLHDRVRDVVFEAIGIGEYSAETVHAADRMAMALEVRDLTTRPDLYVVHGLPKKKLEPWKPQTAKIRFLQQYTRLARLITEASHAA